MLKIQISSIFCTNRNHCRTHIKWLCLLCWALCTYWVLPCSKYCTRTGLWLPFDYCDLAGSKVKNLRVISCIIVFKDLVKRRFCTIWNYIMDNFDIFITAIEFTGSVWSIGHIWHFQPFNLFNPEIFLDISDCWDLLDLFDPLSLFYLLNNLDFWTFGCKTPLSKHFGPLNLLNILDKENFSTI